MKGKNKLSLVLGRAGTGKSRFCLEEVRHKLKENPIGEPLIYIVPDQVVFQFEHALASTPGLEGIIRAQVLSFRRLAWKVMQEVGGGALQYIDDFGKGLMIRKILENHKEDLRVLKLAGEKAGTIAKMVEFYNQLKRSRVTLRLFEQHSRCHDKFKDLAFIFLKLEKKLAGLYQDSEDFLELLACSLNHSSYLSNAEIWVDDFYEFTNQEYKVLEGLLTKGLEVTVTLCLDKNYSSKEKIEELSPFYPTALTCRKLNEMVERVGVNAKAIILKSGQMTRFSQRPQLMHLEKNLTLTFPKPYEGKAEDSVGILTAVNRRWEIEHIAGQMIILARDKGYRWRDMSIMAPDLESYKDIISTVFREYDIPFFLEHKRTVLHHPLIEFVRSALEVVCFNWNYDAVFRCIKTELLLPPEEERLQGKNWQEHMWQLENYVLAFGISSDQWQSDKPWDYLQGGALEEEKEKVTEEQEHYLNMINMAKEVIREPLVRFQRNVENAVKVSAKIKALQQLLQEIQAVHRLERWSQKSLEEGKPEKAREHLQVCKALSGLLDQMEEIMAEDNVTSAIFLNMLETGFESMRLGLEPSSLDQVLIGDLERTRPGNIKIAFIPGANEGTLPSRPKEDGIITEQERELLIDSGVDLAPGSLRRLFDKQFLIYTVLTRASESLWLSYPLADEEGNALLPSPLVERLKEMIPSIQEIFETGNRDLVLSDIVHPGSSLNSLARQLKCWQKGQKLHPNWWGIYNWYIDKEEWRGPVKYILSGLAYKNRENPLRLEVARDLYGKGLKASISRLEKYRACPFAHFIQYGLRLEERKMYRLEVPDIGQLFHGALLSFGGRVQEEGLTWGELSPEKCVELAEEEVEKLAPRLQKEVLFSTARYRYLIKKLKDTMGRTAVILGKHAKVSSFDPVALELSFGVKGVLPPVIFKLPDGFQVVMGGRIDRVDLARREDGTAYVRIIDYKSGRPELNLAEIYHGLSLQLMVYMDVVLTYARDWLGVEAEPAGILYFYVHAPLIKTNKILKPKEIEKMIIQRYKMKGKVLAELEAVTLMDHSLNSPGYSDIIPAAVKKQGGFYKGSQTMDALSFDRFRQHVRQKLTEASWGISQGRVDIKPIQIGKKKACRFCAYKAVCQFDLRLEENCFEVLNRWPDEEVELMLENGQIPKGGSQYEDRQG
ncbi:helicase-exonuclease AddAB subunit AddB [Candidatus Contubernalis alkaliaceticus]|uniref:helicase-exonuclease AddAB subunit AddB n=1 Tax=Candidatus Contubernalis alkaliaceticus TaxID=338645 RepID=UPI001F4BD333|nr:helicase-exonuclease AddAB subunit AddB [Candidatus Contubernalis alkalaceticus]UNC91797.1 helicase-exonuclease AddAB subunit AddB [Candidatus Contubernalis alkalaceticus]